MAIAKRLPQYTLGIDIGGTKIQAGLVSSQNRISSNRQFPMIQSSKKSAIAGIMAAIQSLMSPNVRAIGVGITGHVDMKAGIVRHSANLPKSWNNVPLKRIIEKKFNRPVTIDNDGHCIALAEAIYGAGKNHSVVLGMTIGTGIGCGLVINKKIYHGAENIIEVGHTIISDKHVRCHCGGYGHFEALVSGPAMTYRYRELTGKTSTPHEIEKLARSGNKIGRKIFREMSEYLARGLINTLYSYNPNIIVLGGGLGKVDILVKPAIALVRQRLFYKSIGGTKIVMSRLKYDAGVLGAALITK